MGRFVRVAYAADVPPGRGKAFRVGGRRVALFHDAKRGFFATDDACPHEGTSLGDGLFHEGRVICPLHGWIFEVGTGACLHRPGVRLACYATRPAGDTVEVEFSDEAAGDRDAGQADA